MATFRTDAERELLRKRYRKRVIENWVRDGNRSPDSAEDAALKEGLGTYHQVRNEDRWMFEAADWSIQYAIFWIACREREAAASAHAEFRFWGGRIWRNAMRERQRLSLARAEFDLRQQLGRATLMCSALIAREIYFVRTERREDVESSAWLDAKWKDEATRDIILLYSCEARDLTLRRSNVLDLWPIDLRESLDNVSTKNNTEAKDHLSNLQKATVSKSKLKLFLESQTDLPQPEEKLLARAVAEFPNLLVPRKMIRALIRALPEDQKFMRGHSPSKGANRGLA